MNHDELIKSMKDKGITVKVDNGNKLEFSNGETYVKDSHSDEYKKTKNYMESRINIRKLVESRLFEINPYENAPSTEMWQDLMKLSFDKCPEDLQQYIVDWGSDNDMSKEDAINSWNNSEEDRKDILNDAASDMLFTYEELADFLGYETNNNENYNNNNYNLEDESTLSEVRGRKPNYPVSIEEYTSVLKDQYKKRGWNFDLPEDIIRSKYSKACYVYSDIKKNGNWNYQFNRAKWYDSEFGDLKKPEDAFQIDWDC